MKSKLVNDLLDKLGVRDAEADRLYAHHMTRSYEQVRESLARWCAINGTTQEEIDRNCDLRGLV